MEFNDKLSGEVLVVKPTETRIDSSCATDFKGKMIDYVNEGNNCIAMDLTDVDFIDSSGLGAMISVLKTIDSSGTLAIFGVRDTVMSLFKLTRMDRAFKIFSTEEEAVKSLSNRAS